MNLTTTLTGLLPFVVLLASALAVPVSLGLLALYRRAVMHGMAASAGAAPAPGAAPGTRPTAALRLQRLAGEPLRGTAAALSGWQSAWQAPWRALGPLALAALAYAIVMTAAWLASTGSGWPSPKQAAMLLLTYLWPLRLAAGLVLALGWRERLALTALYLALLAAVITVAVARNPGLPAFDLCRAWVFTVGPPTVLAWLMTLRRLRAVGPLVLAGLLLALLGSQLLMSLAGTSEAVLRAIVVIGGWVGLGGTGAFYAVVACGLALFAALAWPLLRALGRAYQRQRLSDQQVTLAALWLMFGLVQGVDLVFEHPAWMLAGAVAFGAWWAVWGLARRAFGTARPVAGQRLLLLRVFRLGARSEALLDRLRAHWSPRGPVRLIAGPDLVTSTVEPHEFLGFLAGELQREFVSGEADLAQRLQALPSSPDPDGRHRLEEFFCRNDTWQMTMQRLAQDSEAVLMDLRSFGPGNAGCTWEIGRLLSRVPLSRVVLLVDEGPLDFLEATLQAQWQSHLDTDSPNRALAEPVLRLLPCTAPDGATTRRLLAALCPA